MSEVRIICINKDGGNHTNPHEAISQYGWINSVGERGRTDRPTMVDWLEEGNRAYVEDIYGNRAYCAVRKDSLGTKFLQTVSDGMHSNNLLSLSECSI